MGDRAADGTGKGEAGVELEAGELARLFSLDVLDNGIELGRAGGLCGRGHCERLSRGRLGLRGEDSFVCEDEGRGRIDRIGLEAGLFG